MHPNTKREQLWESLTLSKNLMQKKNLNCYSTVLFVTYAFSCVSTMRVEQFATMFIVSCFILIFFHRNWNYCFY